MKDYYSITITNSNLVVRHGYNSFGVEQKQTFNNTAAKQVRHKEKKSKTHQKRG